MLYHFKSMQPLKTINIQEREFYIWTVRFLWTFYKIDRFVIGLFETSLWSLHLHLLEKKQGVHTCVVPNFHPGLEKMSIFMENKEFSSRVSRLKFHLGLTKPSWNFNSAYKFEIFTCNCNAISKTSLLFSRDNISVRFNELKFRPGLKTSIMIGP